MPSYYFSEMNVSAKHGGGLSLMRILGEDLSVFDGIIRLQTYDHHLESHHTVTKKEINLFKDPGEFQLQPMPPRLSWDYLSNQFKRILKLPNYKYIDRHYYQKYYTEYLQQELDLQKDHFLVVPQKSRAVIYMNYLHRQYGTSYVTWVMDDHVLKYDIETGQYFYPGSYEEEFAYHLQQAKHVFVISDNMGQFYHQRFGIDYSVLFSPADIQAAPEFRDIPSDKSLRFCHFGRVWKWPLDAVERFSAQLEKINAELDIFSHQPLEGILLDNPRVNVKEPVGGDEVMEIMQSYDAVTIFYGFRDEVRHWTEMNISTKMSECLASGIPAIFVGPDYAAMTQFAVQHHCGIIIDNPEDERQLKRVSALKSPGVKEEAVRKNQQVADKYTSIAVMKERWSEGWMKILKD